MAVIDASPEPRGLPLSPRPAIAAARVCLWIGLGVVLLATAAGFAPARADLRLCNMTTSRVGVSLGFRDQQGWVTEGWWNISSNACETLLRGDLAARFYYIHALDYDRGGEWGGKSFMCTRDREFTIRGADNCLARGFDRTGFFEVDSGEQKSWTIQLLDPTRPAPTAPPLPGASPPPINGQGAPGAPSNGLPSRIAPRP